MAQRMSKMTTLTPWRRVLLGKRRLRIWESYCKRGSVFPFLQASLHWFLLVHIQLTANDECKDFVKFFFERNQTIEVGPWSRTMEKYHLPWSDFMVQDVHRPLFRPRVKFLMLDACEVHSYAYEITLPFLSMLRGQTSSSGTWGYSRLGWQCVNQELK